MQILYSGKFLRGRKFCDFRDQTPTCKNFSYENVYLQKVYADNELRKLSTLSSSHGFSNSNREWTHFVVETLSKLQKFFSTYDQLACHRRNCKWILGFSLQALGWQFFINSNPQALIRVCILLSFSFIRHLRGHQLTPSKTHDCSIFCSTSCFQGLS